MNRNDNGQSHLLSSIWASSALKCTKTSSNPTVTLFASLSTTSGGSCSISSLQLSTPMYCEHHEVWDDKKTTSRKKKPGQYLLTAIPYPNAIHPAAHTPTVWFQRNPLHGTTPGKNLLPGLMYPSKLFYSADLSTAHFIPFFTASPNSIWLSFHCCLSVTIIILLIAPSTAADVVTATSSITELTGLAVTKKASSLFEISWTSIAKSDLTSMKAAFHGLW